MVAERRDGAATISPSVARIVSILNFLAQHPRQSFSLAEIVRSLRLSRTTCHTMLGALVEAGYLYRTAERSYVLGPALASVGRIAYENSSPLQVAQPEMRALADRFDAIGSAVFKEGDQLVVRASAVAASHVHWPNPIQTIRPWQPPVGSVFLTWAKESEIRRWLDRAAEPVTDGFVEALRGALAFTRTHGYSFAVRRKPASDPRAAQELFGTFEDTELLNGTLDPTADYQLASINGVVFDALGEPAFSIVLGGFTSILKGTEVAAVGEHVRAACDRITAFGGGRIPHG